MQQLFFSRAEAVDQGTTLNHFSNTVDLPRMFHTDPSSSSACEGKVHLGPECKAQSVIAFNIHSNLIKGRKQGFCLVWGFKRQIYV